MRIAITSENKMIFQHFGHCKEFTLIDIDGEKIIGNEIIDTSKSGHGALAVLLKEKGVNVLICGGIGGGARTALEENNIELIPGVTGSVEEAVVKYLSGENMGDPDFVCNHHGEHEHGEGHKCGEH